MKKFLGIFINTILVLGLFLILQTNKTFAADSFETATELKQNIEVEERIEAGEEDYYYFSTQESGIYDIYTISDIDTFGNLYDENYNEITWDNDSNGNVDFKISIELEANKKYYVKVSGYDSSIEGDYKIVLKKSNIRSISGTVSLPNGEVAPSGGIYVTINTIKIISENNWYYESGKTVHIEKDQNSVDYSVPVACDETGGNYKIKYDIYNNYYARSGYYNINGTVVDRNSATVLEINRVDMTGVDITLLPIRKITGTVSLPNGKLAPTGGVDVYIYPIRIISGNDVYYELGKTVHIEEGQNLVEYTVSVACEENGGKFKIGYDVYNEDYVEEGYYNINNTVIDRNSATVLEINGVDITGVDISLLPIRKITGTVSLPNGEVAPTGGIGVNIYPIKIISENDWYYESGRTAYIEEGENSVQYRLPLACDESGGDYKIRYYIDSEDYVREGYYNIDGTVQDINSASVIEINREGMAGIDITLLPIKKITAKISLPNGEVAPTGGLDIYIQPIRIISENYNRNEPGLTVHIEEGANSVEEIIPTQWAETDGKYKIQYYYEYNGDYVSGGYYNTNGTVIDIDSASVIELVGIDITRLDVILLPIKKITGTISLPNGEVAPMGGMDVNIYPMRKVNENDWYSESCKTVHIEEEQNSVDYSMPVASDETGVNYKIRYDYMYNGDFTREGYYNIDGTVQDIDSASVIEIYREDIAGIDITLLPIKKISGTVSLPNGEVAPIGGLDIYIQPIIMINEVHNVYEPGLTVHIEEEANSVDYTVPIECDVPGINYKIGYYINHEVYVREGYYNINRTVTSINSASVIQVNGLDITGINIELLPARKITGKIYLPNGEVAPEGGMHIYIQPMRKINEYSYSYEQGKYIYIEEGENSAEYKVYVACDETVSYYKIGYNIYNTGYEIDGYYSVNGTVVNRNSASIIEVNGSDITGIDITMLQIRKISGRVFLPNGEVAPTGGMYVNIEAKRKINQYSYNYEQGASVYIQEGENSANYDLQIICSGTRSEYKIGYRMWDNKINYVQLGYYGLNGTIADENSASIVELLDQDINDIDIEIIKGVLISGKISLPDGKVAPSNGMYINILVSDEQSTMHFDTYAYLQEEENESNYYIAVPIEDESISYIIGYAYYEYSSPTHDSPGKRSMNYKIESNDYEVSNRIYVKNGYYNSEETTTNVEKATLVEVLDNNIENINMTLISGKLIKGIINIPNNIDIIYNSLELEIVASDEVNDIKVQTNVYLEMGTTSKEYNLVVPSDSTSNYKVYYELPEYYGGNSLKRGYYSNNGTVPNRNAASLINISSDEITSIDMTILRLQDIPDDYSDNIQDATLIESNGVNDGIMNHKEDKDYFKFEVLQTSIVKVYTTGNLDTIGELFNSNGERIMRNEYGGTYNNFYMIKVLEPGTYFIGVSSYDLGVYNLNVETIINSSENQYKISIEDRSQTPTIEAVYFEGQRATHEFNFRSSLLREISKVGNEYVVTLAGFDWSRADKYYVWINDGTYLLRQVLTSADKGKTIILRPDDTYTKIKIDIENAGLNFNVQNLSLYQDWDNGQTMFIDNINKDMYIPMGKYSMQINGYNETYGYSLLKNKVDISVENNVIYFDEDELAKLSVNMEDHTGGELKLAVFSAAYFNSTYSLDCPSDIKDIYVSKANYNRIWINFVNKDKWEYGYTMDNSTITEDKVLNFDSEFSCKINLENSHFNPNEERDMRSQLQITDTFNNRLTYISNRNIQGYNFLEGKIKLENTKETYEISVGELDYPYIVLPNTNGTFYMTFYVDEGPIKIKSATTIITIGDPNAGTIINYDLNSDGYVDVNDIDTLGEAYGTENGDSSYDVNEDLNGDGVIDIFDLVILSKKIK